MKRKCFLTDEYVFFAEERAKRPHSFKKSKIAETPKEYCPFCIENEGMTPPLVYSTPDNKVRIVPNKYPYVTTDEYSFGTHDVLIDTDDHELKLSSFSDDEMFSILKVIKNRVQELEKDKRLEYVQVFKNQGIDAGASQSHSHWQIAGLTVVPSKVEGILNRLKNYKKDNEKCYFCSLSHEDRIVEENDEFIAYCPFDSKFSHEIYIIPKKHISTIVEFEDFQLNQLGILLRNSLYRLSNIYEGISYNICIYNPPINFKERDSFHFFIQIIPRIGHMAGFEFSTGCFINSTYPEVAAENLRRIKLGED